MSSWGLLRKAEVEGSSPGFAREIFGEGSMFSLALVCSGHSESDAGLAVYVGRKLTLGRTAKDTLQAERTSYDGREGEVGRISDSH